MNESVSSEEMTKYQYFQTTIGSIPLILLIVVVASVYAALAALAINSFVPFIDTQGTEAAYENRFYTAGVGILVALVTLGWRILKENKPGRNKVITSISSSVLSGIFVVGIFSGIPVLMSLVSSSL